MDCAGDWRNWLRRYEIVGAEPCARHSGSLPLEAAPVIGPFGEIVREATGPGQSSPYSRIMLNALKMFFFGTCANERKGRRFGVRDQRGGGAMAET